MMPRSSAVARSSTTCWKRPTAMSRIFSSASAWPRHTRSPPPKGNSVSPSPPSRWRSGRRHQNQWLRYRSTTASSRGVAGEPDGGQASLKISTLKAEHYGGNHGKGETAHAIHQPHRLSGRKQLRGQLMHNFRAVATQGRRGQELPRHPAPSPVIGTIAIGQRTTAQQLTHTPRPRALGGIAATEKIGHRPLTADEHQLLP